VAVSSDDGSLRLLGLRDGRQLWPLPWVNAQALGPVTMDAYRVYVGGDDGHVRAFSRRTGGQIWEQETGGVIRARPHLSEGRLFVGSDNGYLYSFDAYSGALRWKLLLGSAIGAEVAVIDEVVVCGTVGARIYGISDKQERVVWEVQTAGAALGPALAVGQVAVLGCDDRNVYVVKASSGKLLHKIPTEGIVRHKPAVDDGTVYICTTGGEVYAFKKDRWALAWIAHLDCDISGGLAAGEDALFVGTSEGRVVELAKSDGKLRGNFSCKAPATVTADLVYLAGWLVVGLEDGRVEAFIR